MYRLIRNQYRLYRSAGGQLVRLFESSVKLALSDMRETKLKNKAYQNVLQDALRKEAVVKELEESIFGQDDIKITFAAAIRYIGNINCRLPLFLNSIIENTDDLKRVEVLLMIDSDDDIEYFLRIKRQYGNRFRLCIYVSPQRFGYEKLHLYDKILFKKIAPKTLMIGDYSDDVRITRRGYDTQLIEIDNRFPDKIYFIHTRHTNRDEFLGDVSKETYRLYWMMQAHGPLSFFPIFSRRVLEVMEDALQELPEAERANWSPFANAWICDCYIDAISTMLRAKGYNRILQVDMMRMHHYNLFVSYQHNRDGNNLSASERALINLTGSQTRKHIDTIATYLANAIDQKAAQAKSQIMERNLARKARVAN